MIKRKLKSVVVKPEGSKVEALKPAPSRSEAAIPEPIKPSTSRNELAKPAASVPPPMLHAAKPPVPKVTRVAIELVKPEAKTVSVAGSFNGWKPEQTPLIRTGNGRWVGDLSVDPGRYEYLFVVDGQWVPDPNARESVQNPFGGKNSVLIVSE